MSSLFAFLEPGPVQLLILLTIGILFFGRKLPDLARSLGKGIVEFKKGLRGLEDDLDTPAAQHPQVRYDQQTEAPRPPQKVATTAPKFEDQAPAVAPPTAVTPPPKV